MTAQLAIAGVNCLPLSPFSKLIWFSAFSANTLPWRAGGSWGRGWAGFLSFKTDLRGGKSALDCLGKQQAPQKLQLCIPVQGHSLREGKGGSLMLIVPSWVYLWDRNSLEVMISQLKQQNLIFSVLLCYF